MRLVCFIAVVFFSLWSGVASAQDAGPVIGSDATDQAQSADSTAVDVPYRILIIGDSMGGGMGSGLARMAEGEPKYEVVNRFNESSALSRPDRYDWATSIPKIMEGKNFSAVVVLIGLNDRQDIRTPTARLTFNSPEWIAAYRANVDAVIDALFAQKVKVIWLGEPPMGDAAYDADMQTISALQKERAVAKSINFVDLRAPFLGSDGKYSARGPDDTGVDQKLRQNDGVTFLRLGNNRLGQIALAAIKDGVQPIVPPANGAAAPSVSVDNSGPVFAQQGADGSAVLHSGQEIVAAAANQQALTQATAASSIGIIAPQGSTAEKLFNLGIAPTAPPGRFDDFTYVAPPAAN